MKAVKEDPKPSPKLLITPLALQNVQLRSVKRREKDNNAESDKVKPQEPGLDLLQDLKSQTLEPPTVVPPSISSREEDSCKSSASSVVKLLEDLSICGNATNLRKSEDQCDGLLNRGETVECHLSFFTPPQSSQSSPVKQKPPAVSKKPQISFVPPFCAQPLNGHLDRDPTSLSQTDGRTDTTAKEQDESKTEIQQSLESCDTSAASPVWSDPESQDSHLSDGPGINGDAQEEDTEDGSNSVAGSVSSKEDDNGESHWI